MMFDSLLFDFIILWLHAEPAKVHAEKKSAGLSYRSLIEIGKLFQMLV